MMSLLLDWTLIELTGGADSQARGSSLMFWCSSGAGVMVSACGLYSPTMRITAPAPIVNDAELPFVDMAPPLATVQVESM
jgi:hypothetical protein